MIDAVDDDDADYDYDADEVYDYDVDHGDSDVRYDNHDDRPLLLVNSCTIHHIIITSETMVGREVNKVRTAHFTHTGHES